MPTQKKITYLLGAGASYHALPIVQEMPQELSAMITHINKYELNSKRNEPSSLNKTTLLIQSLKEAHSIDTLARKYWLASKGDVDDEFYIRVKNLIAALIIYKQLPSQNGYKFENQSKEKRSFQKLDRRYDAFFSALLTSDIQLPANINILSWNYDFQIEQSIQFYHQDKSFVEVGNDLGIWYDKHKSNDLRNIVKLNGTALLSTPSENIKYDHYEDLHDTFIHMLKDDPNRNYQSLIHFAW